MILELKYNPEHETLDLVGRLPAGTKYKVAKVMTHNPDLSCYQGAVDKQVLQLAKNLDANISPEVINAIEKKARSLALLKKRDKKFKSNHRTETTSTDNFTVSTYGATAEERDEDKMIGYIVWHRGHGYGRILEIKDREFRVSFFDPPSEHQLDIRDIHRAHAHGLLPIGTTCTAGKRICKIEEKEPGNDQNPHTYKVKFIKDGMFDKLPETEVTPKERPKPSDPLEAMVTQQQEGYPLFVARERLVQAHNELIRRGAGVRSLLSSRIDLHPHQAYVAGTVILDNKQRYLLADEVGLGKTIEAGIIIYNLLACNPEANILIICPGMLAQQWFSEMHSKFCGEIFCLPELSGTDSLTEKETQKFILPFHTALLAYKEKKIGHKDRKWDLVVVDEVHHLLRSRSLYKLTKKLSLQDCGLLLLSALPAQRHDKEYYDLLALLEPEQYKQSNSAKKKHFSKLLERQQEIGGRIGVINHRLSELQEVESTSNSRVIKQLKTLREIPVLRKDQVLKKDIDKLRKKSESFVVDVHKIVHYISDYYRINRRILRNRRKKLIEDEQFERIQRGHKEVFYEPDQFEINVLASLTKLLQFMQEAKLPVEILLPLTRHLFQASTHPATLLETIRFGEEDLPTVPLEEEYEEIYDLVSYSEIGRASCRERV